MDNIVTVKSEWQHKQVMESKRTENKIVQLTDMIDRKNACQKNQNQ